MMQAFKRPDPTPPQYRVRSMTYTSTDGCFIARAKLSRNHYGEYVVTFWLDQQQMIGANYYATDIDDACATAQAEVKRYNDKHPEH